MELCFFCIKSSKSSLFDKASVLRATSSFQTHQKYVIGNRPLLCREYIIQEILYKNKGCWCPGSLCHQVSSSNCVENIRHVFYGVFWDMNDRYSVHNCALATGSNSNLWNTVRCRYNAVNFRTNIHKRHPIAHPSGWGMGCLLWIQHLIDMLPQFLWSFM